MEISFFCALEIIVSQQIVKITRTKDIDKIVRKPKKYRFL